MPTPVIIDTDPGLDDAIAILPGFPLEAGVYPTDARADVSGQVIGFARAQELYGHGDIAFLSLGTDQNVAVGDEFEVRPPQSADGDWPVDAVGRMQIVRVEEDISSARIIGITNPVFVPGARVHLIRKMPPAS